MMLAALKIQMFYREELIFSGRFLKMVLDHSAELSVDFIHRENAAKAA